MLMLPADTAQMHGRVRRSAGRRNRQRSVDTHQRVHAKGQKHLQGFTPQAAPSAARLRDHDLHSRRSAVSAKDEAACLRHQRAGRGRTSTSPVDLSSGSFKNRFTSPAMAAQSTTLGRQSANLQRLTQPRQLLRQVLREATPLAQPGTGRTISCRPPTVSCDKAARLKS